MMKSRGADVARLEEYASNPESVIDRYQRCARRIWALFPVDPLGDSPAQSLVERLEALLDRGLLARGVEAARLGREIDRQSREWSKRRRRFARGLAAERALNAKLRAAIREFLEDTSCGCSPGPCDPDCSVARFRAVLEVESPVTPLGVLEEEGDRTT